MKNTKQGDEKSSPNNNDNLRNPSSKIGVESRKVSFRKRSDDDLLPPTKVDDQITTTRGTGKDWLPPQYTTEEVEPSPGTMENG